MCSAKTTLTWLLTLLISFQTHAQLSKLDTATFHMQNETIIFSLNGPPRPYTMRQTFARLKALYIGTQSNYLNREYRARPGKEWFYITDTVDTLAFRQWEHPKKFVHLVYEGDTIDVFVNLTPREKNQPTEEYKSSRTDKIFIQNSKFDELMSILVKLAYPRESDLSDEALIKVNEENLATKNPHQAYLKNLEEHFVQYSGHPAVQWFDFLATSNNFQTSVEMLIKSIKAGMVSYHFSEEGKVVKEGPYKSVAHGRYIDLILEEINQFVTESGFNEFYKNNEVYYKYRKEQIVTKVNVDQIKSWLDKKFPEEKSYSIFLNDLGSWSNHAMPLNNAGLAETLIFLSTPEVNFKSNTDEHTKLMLAGELFFYMCKGFTLTFAQEHKTEMNMVMEDISEWDNRLSNSPMARINVSGIFSTYLTWSMFLSYVKDQYGIEQYDLAVPKVLEHMVSLGYGKFEKFYQAYVKGHSKGDDTELSKVVNMTVINLR